MGPRVCGVPGCPELTAHPSGKCDDCRAEANRKSDARRPSASERGYDARWRERRERYLEAHPTCCLCFRPSEVPDHWPVPRRDLVARGVADPDEDRYLRPLCTRCHNRETARAARGAYTTPFVLICGAAGTGKTEVRRRLAMELGVVSLGPDDHGGDWSAIYDALDASDYAIVECCRIPRALRLKAQRRRAVIVELTAAEATRVARLAGRGEAHDSIPDLLVHGSLGYEDHIEPDLRIATDELAADEAAERVLAAVRDLT